MAKLPPLVFELHTDVQGGTPGLIGAYNQEDNPTFQALHKSYGEYSPNYSRDFRGGNLGAPKRGVSILELQGSPGVNFTPEQVDEAAQKAYNTFMSVESVKSGNRPIHLFAGHGDVTSGETGAPGEKPFIKAVKARIKELASGNSNFYFHSNTGEHIASADDPLSNWSRGAKIISDWSSDAKPSVSQSPDIESVIDTSSATKVTPSARSTAVERVKNYANMSKQELNDAYDKMRSDPEKARVEGMKMHKAFFNK